MTLYAVQATVQRFDDHGWLSGRCLPTFFLDSAVQGITDTEHAKQIAAHMLHDAAGPGAIVNLHVEPKEPAWP